MKYFKSGVKLLTVALLLVMTACGSSNSTKQTNKQEGTEGNEYMTLEDHLRRIRGVQISGSGNYAKVRLRNRGVSNVSRGMGSPDSKTDMNMRDSDERQPLFVIDGQKVGRSYPDVRDMLTIGQIKSVRLLPDSEAAQYGGQSGSGVIEIITKTKGMQNK